MKDSRHKYLDIAQGFNARATEVDLFCKQSQRICELLANRLASKKCKTPAEFENNEYWKDFVMKTAKNNEATIDLLKFMHGFLIDIMEDSKVLMEGAVLRDKLQFQSDTIEVMINEREKQVNEIRTRNKANS